MHRPTALAFACSLAIANSVFGAEFMFEATFDGRKLEGQPLAWNDTQMLLLARDGGLHTVDPREAKDARRTAPKFAAYTTSELRQQLYAEYGQGFSVTSTGHYLVVHPPGEADAWAQRFEELYRSFRNYFRVRGFTLTRPPYPLVAVIFPTRDDYYRHANAQEANLLPSTLGHYDPESNRVFMYDRVGNRMKDWGSVADTIIHEATHQTAYNVGLHSRTNDTPQWLVEGLATMFEARGVYRSEARDTRRDRINRLRLDDYRYYSESDSAGHTLAEMVASDRAFRTNAPRAYAEAWALTFYLSETRPREYEQYLTLTASQPSGTDYSPAERLADFRSVFGDDLEILEANFVKWMKELE